MKYKNIKFLRIKYFLLGLLSGLIACIPFFILFRFLYNINPAIIIFIIIFIFVIIILIAAENSKKNKQPNSYLSKNFYVFLSKNGKNEKILEISKFLKRHATIFTILTIILALLVFISNEYKNKNEQFISNNKIKRVLNIENKNNLDMTETILLDKDQNWMQLNNFNTIPYNQNLEFISTQFPEFIIILYTRAIKRMEAVNYLLLKLNDSYYIINQETKKTWKEGVNKFTKEIKNYLLCINLYNDLLANDLLKHESIIYIDSCR